MTAHRRRAPKPGILKEIHQLYEGGSRRAYTFRYGLLAFDLATLAFLVVSSFYVGTTAVEIIDAVIGLVILADFTARVAISRQPVRDLMHPAGVADTVVIASLFAPILGEGFAFLRVMRTLRLLRSYPLLARLKRDFAFFRRNEELVLAIVHLAIFVFVMTALVYETQHRTNPNIHNYGDALYFTITTLTTTGFGDITLTGTSGRLISVLIMIFGVSLFVHLIRVVFRPSRIHHECPSCGLLRHEADAVHCRHCGAVLHIPREGEE